ncbi:MAG: hypothetical protein QG608_765 [Actinomycetota bacterium]|nr:hypothetical protein [Actinomycetota bacterium]
MTNGERPCGRGNGERPVGRARPRYRQQRTSRRRTAFRVLTRRWPVIAIIGTLLASTGGAIAIGLQAASRDSDGLVVVGRTPPEHTPVPAAESTPRPTSPTTAALGTALPAPSRTASPSPTTSPSAASRSVRDKSAGKVPFDTRCAVSATLVPECGVYWGIYSRRYGDQDTYVSATTWEKNLGRRFDIVLKYFDFSGRRGPGQFPDKTMSALGSSRILLFDWESKIYSTGTMLRWADIAAGKYDRTIVIPQARRIKAQPRTVMLGLDHEMDLTHAEHGTAAEYKAMYRHIHDVFAAQGVHNVVWTWVTSGYLGEGNDQRILSLYPGDDLVDWIGYDPYNFHSCHDNDWKTFETTVDRFYDWSARNGLGNKPLLIQEYGTRFDSSDPGASQQWYRDIPGVLAERPRIKAIVRWDSDTSCTLRIDSGPGMVAAFATASQGVARP